MCFTAQKGRTLHLLKQGSKNVPANRKRRKIDLAGTFDEYIKATVPLSQHMSSNMGNMLSSGARQQPSNVDMTRPENKEKLPSTPNRQMASRKGP